MPACTEDYERYPSYFEPSLLLSSVELEVDEPIDDTAVRLPLLYSLSLNFVVFADGCSWVRQHRCDINQFNLLEVEEIELVHGLLPDVCKAISPSGHILTNAV